MLKPLVLSTLLFGAAAAPAYAVVYSTDFSSISSSSGGTPQGDGSIWGVTSFSTGSPAATWSSSVGNFDYLKSGNSGYSCVGGSGGCIELGGSYTSPPSKVDFTLNLAPGNYAIAFDYNRQKYGPSGFELMIDGVTVESFEVLAADNIWRTHTEAFTTSGGAVTFSFVTGSLNQNVGTLIDNVTVVPEPETYALMLAGLGLVGFMARRRKLAAA